jgi:hypothetical protein
MHADPSPAKYQDLGTKDFLTGLMERHEKMAWMFRSFSKGSLFSSNGKRFTMSAARIIQFNHSGEAKHA